MKSVEKFNTAPIKYIFVDNNSKKEVVDKLSQCFSTFFDDDYLEIGDNYSLNGPLPKFTFVKSKTNSGYASGNNKGLRLAYQDNQLENILILNNDVLFVADIIPDLEQFFKNTADAALVSPILYKKDLADLDYNCARKALPISAFIRGNFFYPFRWTFHLKSKPKWHKGMFLLKSKDFNPTEPIKIELPSGSCMFTSKTLMHSLGDFDEHTFLYYEENILYAKINQMGKCSYLLPNLKCIHLGAQTTNNSGSIFTLREGMKSQKYYVLNYRRMSLPIKSIYLVSYVSMMTYMSLKGLVRRLFNL